MPKRKKNKLKEQESIKVNREMSALFFALLSFLSTYVFVVPERSGIIGHAFFVIVFSIFGMASYALSFIFFWYFIIYIRQSIKIKERIDFIFAVLSLISLSILFESMRLVFKVRLFGGWIGVTFYPFFGEMFGDALSFILIFVIFFIISASFLRISIVSLLYNFVKKLIKDIKASKHTESILQKQTIETFDQFIKPNIVNRSEREDKKITEIDNSAVIKQESLNSKSFNYKLPPVELLKNDATSNFFTSKDDLLKRAELLKNTLRDFGIDAEIKDIIPGPVVTRYDLVLAPGVRIQVLYNIADNISLAMRTSSIRIVPIPEKAVVGIEVPNPQSTVVGLRGILESRAFINASSLLSLALGKTMDGIGYVTDLVQMPHLLIAGATGSGKSVGIHTIILSILYKARPDEVKFLLIDPKRVEMPIYRDIPHLYNPCVSASQADIITNPREASVALKKLVIVMEERYEKFAKLMVRNIEEYNSKMIETSGEKEFYIVVIIDELADLMLIVQKEIEDSIQRLAQMARAVGVHLILATQRPSVNVITGVIKANFPARLSFQTTSKIDSRVILDTLGAEALMGKGDMLFLPPGEARPTRLQGAFVSLQEAEKIISFINAQNFPKFYEPIITEVDAKSNVDLNKEKGSDIISALKLINERKRISQDLLKANFGGSARATNILSILEVEGFISKPEGTNKWHIDFDKISKYLENVGN
ncbi:MAG: DNA translocase FtsK [Endomicrobium sp.]|uniref:FtsK/SpoIIIE family DNA translocase n=1 Tax=Candidatus Endomicrobiellum cubanum TaxID=3242325 RepID=UPI0028358991|nr:DNA translocase FtsK [Endomicrobium sp.]